MSRTRRTAPSLRPHDLNRVRAAVQHHGLEAVANAAGVAATTLGRLCAHAGAYAATRAAVLRAVDALEAPAAVAS